MTLEYDFFISYNKADAKWAEWVAWQLEKAKFTTILQAWDFLPGSNFALDMQKAAGKARRTIIILSPNYLESIYTQPEWAAAFAKDPTGEKGLLVPVRVRACEIEGVLAQIVYIDLVNLDERTARIRLIKGIKLGRHKPFVAPRFPGIGKHPTGKQPQFPGSFPIKSANTTRSSRVSLNRRVLYFIALLGIMVFVSWYIISEEHQKNLLRLVSDTFTLSKNKADLVIEPFKVTDPDIEESKWLRTKLERKLVEYFSESGLAVSHQLTLIGKKDDVDHALTGSVSKKGELFELEVTLRRKSIFVSSAHIEGKFPVLEQIYRQFAKGLVYGLDIDPEKLKPLNTKSRPTDSATSYAMYLAAQKLASAGKYIKAIELLDSAIDRDTRFAMAYWAKAKLYRRIGDEEQAKLAKGTAERIDKDHPRYPIEMKVGNPMPNLIKHSAASQWTSVAEGLRTKVISLQPEYNLSLYIWAFNPVFYEIGVVSQIQEYGSTTRQLREHFGAVLAINGGFFEIDSKDRLWPSGLLIVDHKHLHPYRVSKGSGLLYQKMSVFGLDWSKNYHIHAESVSAVQAGPFLVDPGGKNGIYKNDFDRRRRSAVCLAEDNVIFVSVDGDGLSLFELGEFLSKRSNHGGMGCYKALNLDGGASTQVSFASDDSSLEVEGIWKIQNAVVVWRK